MDAVNDSVIQDGVVTIIIILQEINCSRSDIGIIKQWKKKTYRQELSKATTK